MRKNGLSQLHNHNPIKAIIIIVFVLLFSFFYESKRVATISAGFADSFLRSFALSYTGASENLKSFLGLTAFFEQEKVFWEMIKKSPKVFDYNINSVVTNPPPISPKPVILPAKLEPPYRLLIVGDSFIAERFGPGLEKELLLYKDTTVYRKGIYSTGLSRPDYFDWNKQIKELIEAHSANVVIVLFGANDAQDLKTVGGKTITHYGDKNWNEEYGKKVSAFLDIFAENKITVFWIGNPIARDDYYLKRMANLNYVFQNECSKYKNCYFISTWDVLKDSKGKYSAYLPDATGKNRLARASDGIHTTPFGAEILIKAVMTKIKERMKLEIIKPVK